MARCNLPDLLPSLHKEEPPIRDARRLKTFLPVETFIDGVTTRAPILDISSSGIRLHTGTGAERDSDIHPDPAYERMSALANRLREVGEL